MAPGIGLGIGIGFSKFGGDKISPLLSSAEVGTVADNKIVLTYDEALDESSIPAKTDFAITGTAAAVSSVAISGVAVTLTLDSPIYDNETVALSYTAGTNPIQDEAENAVANLTSRAVTNNSSTSTPVQLSIAFVATQFSFKWKAPSTSTLVFHWGDGTTSIVAGNDATEVTTTSSYSGTGTYYFWITGDVLDLTYIIVSGQAFVSGDVSRFGELVNLVVLVLLNAPLIIGSVSGWGNLSLTTALQLQNLGVTGDLSVVSTTNGFVLFCPGLSFNSVNEQFFTGSTSFKILNCEFTTTDVDNFLQSCVNSSANGIAVTKNSPRSRSSDEAIVTLINKGCQVTVHESVPLGELGPELYTEFNAIATGTEADAVTGWTPTGLSGDNEFISQVVEKTTGDYAFKVNANPIPTSGAKINLTTPVTVVAGEFTRIAFDVRHIGSGGTWVHFEQGKVSQDYLYIDDVSWMESVTYQKNLDMTLELSFMENSTTNDGGLYIDNLSVKKVTLPE